MSRIDPKDWKGWEKREQKKRDKKLKKKKAFKENKNKKNHIPREFSKNFEKKIYEIKNENIKNSLMKLIKAVNDDNS